MKFVWLNLAPEAVSAETLAQMKSLAGSDRQVIVSNQRTELEAKLPEIEIAVGHFTPEQIMAMSNLRWYQQWGAGADWLLNHPEVAERDFILTNASGVHAIPISEHIFAFLLGFARALPTSIRAQQAQKWERNLGGQVFELAGKTLLLVGVGAIGSRTAQIASAMGMRVWGVRRNPERGADADIERMVGADRMGELLPHSDFVVLTIPETRETHHLFSKKAFDQMKPGSYLINIGRGGTVDESALVEALQSGKLAGAALDVFETEPLPAQSPLWKMPNVILTAHYSGLTPQYAGRALAIFVDNLRRYTHHEPLRNVVDKRLGY